MIVNAQSQHCIKNASSRTKLNTTYSYFSYNCRTNYFKITFNPIHLINLIFTIAMIGLVICVKKALV